MVVKAVGVRVVVLVSIFCRHFIVDVAEPGEFSRAVR